MATPGREITNKVFKTGRKENFLPRTKAIKIQLPRMEINLPPKREAKREGKTPHLFFLYKKKTKIPYPPNSPIITKKPGKGGIPVRKKLRRGRIKPSKKAALPDERKKPPKRAGKCIGKKTAPGMPETWKRDGKTTPVATNREILVIS